MLVSTWWYLSLEVLLIFFLPVALQIYRKYSWLIMMLFLLPGSFLIEKHVHLTKYLFIVPLAICFADQQVFERLKAAAFYLQAAALRTHQVYQGVFSLIKVTGAHADRGYL